MVSHRAHADRAHGESQAITPGDVEPESRAGASVGLPEDHSERTQSSRRMFGANPIGPRHDLNWRKPNFQASPGPYNERRSIPRPRRRSGRARWLRARPSRGAEPGEV